MLSYDPLRSYHLVEMRMYVCSGSYLPVGWVAWWWPLLWRATAGCHHSAFDEVGKHWDISACSITIPIGINPDIHLVTTRVGVEWRTVPSLFRCYVLVELGHFEYTWTSLTSCDSVTHYFNLFLLFVDSLYCKVEVEDGIILMLF